jgi:LSD1 subclass zinc finger protein
MWQIQCPHCRRSLQLPENLGALEAKCPVCLVVFVPTHPDKERARKNIEEAGDRIGESNDSRTPTRYLNTPPPRIGISPILVQDCHPRRKLPRTSSPRHSSWNSGSAWHCASRKRFCRWQLEMTSRRGSCCHPLAPSCSAPRRSFTAKCGPLCTIPRTGNPNLASALRTLVSGLQRPSWVSYCSSY